MTGRELIIYILENGLENEPVFKDGKFIGFVTDTEAAAMLGVGTASVRQYAAMDWVKSIRIGEQLYIPANFVDKMPMKF